MCLYLSLCSMSLSLSLSLRAHLILLPGSLSLPPYGPFSPLMCFITQPPAPPLAQVRAQQVRPCPPSAWDVWTQQLHLSQGSRFRAQGLGSRGKRTSCYLLVPRRRGLVASVPPADGSLHRAQSDSVASRGDGKMLTEIQACPDSRHFTTPRSDSL